MMRNRMSRARHNERYLHPQGKHWICHVKQGAPANKRSQWPAPWGPFCFIDRERHDEPFNKREAGRQRRAAREFTNVTRRHVPEQRSYDDGWYAAE
jgi:hypothetical protein